MILNLLTSAGQFVGGKRNSRRMLKHSTLYFQDSGEVHWAYFYARRIIETRKNKGHFKIQTSMSPTGYFHIGNFRDTFCAYMVQRALAKLGYSSQILLSFDDYDAFKRGARTIDKSEFDYSGYPLAAANAHASEICRRYIWELKQLGICPTGADECSQTGPAKSTWDTHYQFERYTGGRYNNYIRAFIRHAKQLARLIGVSDPKKLFVVYCRQCGRSQTTVLALKPGQIHYLCRYCHALTYTTDLGQVKPSWNLDWSLRIHHEQIDCEPAGQDHCTAGSTMDRTRPVYARYYHTQPPVIIPYGVVRQFEGQEKISGSRGNGLTITDLLEYFPPLMIFWLYGRKNCRSDLRISLTKAEIITYYTEFDRFLQQASNSSHLQALYKLITDLPLPDALIKIPGFRTIIGLLNTHFYDRGVVLELLSKRGYNNFPALRLEERINQVLHWLATYGGESAWLLAEEVEELREEITNLSRLACLATSATGPALQVEDYRLLYFALFKTTGGPRWQRIVSYYGPDRIQQAIEQFLLTSQRPLRDELWCRLSNQDEKNLYDINCKTFSTDPAGVPATVG